jgi:hypothetical protein
MSFILRLFEEKLKTHKGLVFDKQVVYRSISTSLLSSGMINDPLDSRYSYERGYRFNYPHSFPALYFALSGLVVELETGHNINPLSTRFDNKEIKPRLVFSIHLDGRFVDLTDNKSLNKFSFDEDFPEYLIPTEEWDKKTKQYRDTGNVDRAITHKIGLAAYNSGFDGILYYSYPAWHLKDKYDSHMLSSVCIFMSKEDFCKPKNASCSLKIYKKEIFEVFKKTTDY